MKTSTKINLTTTVGYIAAGWTSQWVAGVESRSFEGMVLWLLASMFVTLIRISTYLESRE